jgi:hypothetical protein
MIVHSKNCLYDGTLSVRYFGEMNIEFCPVCYRFETVQKECDHEYIPIRFTISNGKTAIRKFCKRCKRLTPNAEPESSYKGQELPTRSLAEYHEYLDKLFLEDVLVIQKLCTELRGLSEEFDEKVYSEYLLSDHWRSKRKDILTRDQSTCQICGTQARDVHHLSYVHRGDEYDFELVSLCADCHKKYHLREETKPTVLQEILENAPDINLPGIELYKKLIFNK